MRWIGFQYKNSDFGTVGTENESKIKKLLTLHQPGTVLLAKWLETLGISRDLQKRYKKSGWLGTIGPGAYKRPGDPVIWTGGLYAIQRQANEKIHVGGPTALAWQGQSHYLRMGKEQIWLFSPRNTALPKWFNDFFSGQKIQNIQSSFLPEDIGLKEHAELGYSITIAGPERAMLECLYLAPDKMDLVECYHLMEGLSNLRPALVQELLEACSSVKVKRLFLFMATKAQHQWLHFVDQLKIDLGKGDRSIVKGGRYNAQFQINLPPELLTV
ncbi:type IV toxin-antitoxin system AbiEi family antitoxin [Parachryseolinea silvisoli]|uniref:type IV toxin-antitoxin system AbiEi family antitoxin n=1 Tax=Parachryseolinea silvisoli TaxID=2873601 RepID=UPI002265F39F|nr:type IV toxin-antitoxin system AbiEi family antitoxin [Parachryseolinea silvisoli]MCD9014439.1 type IV toxin-antitoxin system AbiEi family antitoxin [Parachryseolinea silvisoli]